ncbi:EAL domain-containing protein [Devosia rhodophyticola]|uniref:EAL domain-containing protein n=1 Tax=Devosia rhodophyticola TaxID=3026423 RepID=A0ABY7Z0S0_9HYPH|nr:EAL domain-containing protein [Devosia rhodophyticola]WDR06615.1 EAL domain-containing protein [Devosia rhodophyticola]
MQSLVYVFIALAALGLGATGYYGLTLTPLESFLVAVMFACVAVVLVERQLRQRAENRLERAIEDLSRLLSTDAQAGAVLGQRINAMADIDAGPRLEGVEADISVLGTVIRQVAEAVSEIEDRGKTTSSEPERPAPVAPAIEAPVREPEPRISLAQLRQSLTENRLIFHVLQTVKLPQRRAFGHDLVPRLMLEDGDLADQIDFMPRRGGEDVVRQIEQLALMEAVTIARRARTNGQASNLFIPLSRATLSDANGAEQLLATLEANRAVCGGLVFLIADSDWGHLNSVERAVIAAMVKKGIGFSLSKTRSLRNDVAELAARSVRSLRVDAAQFISSPETLTDFHPSDIADYLGRFGIELLATNVTREAQILELLEDGIVLAQGTHIASAGPIRPDLGVDRVPSAMMPRRAEM